MIREKQQLEEAVDYMYRYIDQLNNVTKSLQREDIDITPLTTASGLCIKVAENLLKQIEIIEKSDAHLKEREERYGYKKKEEKKK